MLKISVIKTILCIFLVFLTCSCEVESDLEIYNQQPRNQDNDLDVIYLTTIQLDAASQTLTKLTIIDDLTSKYKAFLTDYNGTITMELGEFPLIHWHVWKILEVYIDDADDNGYDDIIISLEVVLGVGKNSAIPFPIRCIYYQDNKGKYTLEDDLDYYDEIKQQRFND